MSKRAVRICVAIPAYNAADCIADVVRRVQAQGRADDILVVDDGSQDDTGAVIDDLAGVVALHHAKNLGYGAAQRTLIRTFLDDERYESDDVIVFVHADGEMLPEELGRIVHPFEVDSVVDCVTGSRSRTLARSLGYLPRGIERPTWKRGIDRLMTAYLNTAFGLTLSTYFGGYRGVRKRAFSDIPWDRLGERHEFDIAFLAFAGAALELREVPITNIENHSITYSSNRDLLQQVLRLPRRRAEVEAHKPKVTWPQRRRDA